MSALITLLMLVSFIHIYIQRIKQKNTAKTSLSIPFVAGMILPLSETEVNPDNSTERHFRQKELLGADEFTRHNSLQDKDIPLRSHEQTFFETQNNSYINLEPQKSNNIFIDFTRQKNDFSFLQHLFEFSDFQTERPINEYIVNNSIQEFEKIVIPPIEGKKVAKKTDNSMQKKSVQNFVVGNNQFALESPNVIAFEDVNILLNSTTLNNERNDNVVQNESNDSVVKDAPLPVISVNTTKKPTPQKQVNIAQVKQTNAVPQPIQLTQPIPIADEDIIIAGKTLSQEQVRAEYGMTAEESELSFLKRFAQIEDKLVLKPTAEKITNITKEPIEKVKKLKRALSLKNLSHQDESFDKELKSYFGKHKKNFVQKENEYKKEIKIVRQLSDRKLLRDRNISRASLSTRKLNNITNVTPVVEPQIDIKGSRGYSGIFEHIRNGNMVSDNKAVMFAANVFSDPQYIVTSDNIKKYTTIQKDFSMEKRSERASNAFLDIVDGRINLDSRAPGVSLMAHSQDLADEILKVHNSNINVMSKHKRAINNFAEQGIQKNKSEVKQYIRHIQKMQAQEVHSLKNKNIERKEGAFL